MAKDKKTSSGGIHDIVSGFSNMKLSLPDLGSSTKIKYKRDNAEGIEEIKNLPVPSINGKAVNYKSTDTLFSERAQINSTSTETSTVSQELIVSLEGKDVVTSKMSNELLLHGSEIGFRFRDLPAELRLHIIRLCVPRRRTIQKSLTGAMVACPYRKGDKEEDLQLQYLPTKQGINPIFSLSKEISTQALNVLYGENVFVLKLNEQNLAILRRLPRVNRRRILFLTIFIPQDSLLCPRARGFEGLINPFTPLLENLRGLRVLVQTPRAYPSPEDWTCHRLELDMQSSPPNMPFWEFGLRQFLEILNQDLPETAEMNVDFKSTSSRSKLIFAEVLKRSYREIQSHMGDYYFRNRKVVAEKRLPRDDESRWAYDDDWNPTPQ